MIGIKIPLEAKIYLGVLLILAWLGSVGIANLMGRHHVQVKWDAAKKDGSSAVKTLVKDSGRVSTVIKTVYVDKIKYIKEKSDAIVQQVPVYIPADSCPLPGGFRILHDAAANSTVPDASAGTEAAPVPVRDAAATIARNYSTCHQAIANANALWDWIEGQQHVYLELCAEKPQLCSKGK